VRSVWLALLILPLIASGQTNTTTNAKTTGNCSPIVTGNNNVFHFEYCGTDPEQEKKMVEVLKDISESSNKLDAVLEILKPPNILFPSNPREVTSPSKHPGWPH